MLDFQLAFKFNAVLNLNLSLTVEFKNSTKKNSVYPTTFMIKVHGVYSVNISLIFPISSLMIENKSVELTTYSTNIMIISDLSKLLFPPPSNVRLPIF